MNKDLSMNPAPVSAEPQKSIPRAFRYAGILFLLCALLSNIGVYNAADPQFHPLFSGGALGLVAGALVLFCLSRPGVIGGIRLLPKKLLIPGCGLLAVFLYHCVVKRFSFPEYVFLPGEEMLIFCVPVLIVLCWDACKKYIYFTGAFLWGLNVLYLLFRYLQGRPLWRNGITGNENWAAALLLMGGIFVFLAFRERWNQERDRKIFGGIVLGISFLLNIWIGSKGGILCAFLCGCAALYFHGRKGMRLGIAGVILLALLAGTFFFRTHPEKTREIVMKDGRILLYKSAVSLIKANALTGTSQGGFENEFMTHRVPEYFFIFNPAPRSNHPHNHFLFMAGSWGIAGMLCYLLLLFFPLWKTAKKLYSHEECSVTEQCLFYVLLYGLLHGSLDLIMEVWPTQILALTALGALWKIHLASEIKELPESEEAGNLPAEKVLRYCMLAGAAFLSAGGLYCAAKASYAHTQLKRLHTERFTRQGAIELIRKTAQKCPGNYTVNFAFLNLLERKLKDPYSTLFVSEIMLKGNTPNYPGIRMGRGNALMRLRRFPEALEEYRKEAQLFPLTLRPVYNMAAAARAMGDIQTMRSCEQLLFQRMKIRQMDQKDLYKILTGKAIWDLRAGYKP